MPIKPVSLSRATAPAFALVPDRPERPARAANDTPAPGRADGLLSAEEKKRLVCLAKEAFDALTKIGAIDDSFDDWRRREIGKATDGRADGLTSATHRDYRAISAHFTSILGHTGRAFRQALRSGPEIADAEQALHLISEACRKWQLAFPGYPGAICERQFKCRLHEASGKQLSSILYTVNNRGRGKSKKA